MIDVKSISPLELPFLPLERKAHLPHCASIYFVIDQGEVIYIGRSVNLKSRWGCHHKLKSLPPDCRIAWLEISDADWLPQVETYLINAFSPRLNETCPIDTVFRDAPSTTSGLKNKVGSFIESKGISVYQFIKETGISTTTGYKLANDPDHLPSISVLATLCNTYRVQPVEFVYWDGVDI